MRKAFLTNAPEKILIIRLSSIGDILLTTPVIRLLKKKFPTCQIDFVIKKEFLQVLGDHPQVHKFYVFDKQSEIGSLPAIKQRIRQQHYDLIVDLHKNFRSYWLTIGSRAKRIVRYRKGIIQRFFYVKFKLNFSREIVPVSVKYIRSLAPYQIDDDHQGLDFFVNSDVTHQIRHQYYNFWQEDAPKIIGIVPGAHHPTKRWTPEGFSEVINYLTEKSSYKIVLFGNQDDHKLVATFNFKSSSKILNATGQLTLQETGALMDCCDLVLTNDSGLMHLAAALKKKVVAIFGSTTEQLGFFPYTTEHRIVQNNSLSCRPCSHIGRTKCPQNHFKCMNDISAGQVIYAIEQISTSTEKNNN